MTDSAIRILGIDTSLRSTGLGIIELRGSRAVALEYGAVRVSAQTPLSGALLRIYQDVSAWIARHRPAEVAIEGIFYCKNVRTSVVLGESRGVAIAACAAAGVPIYEYAPRQVKQALVGYGSADKSQVRKMLVSMLALSGEPQEDAGDALALAVCHWHRRTPQAVLAPKAL